MDDATVKHTADILKLIRGFGSAAGLKGIPIQLVACCAVAESEHLSIQDVYEEYDGSEDTDIVLVRIADRFIKRARAQWGDMEFCEIIKIEHDLIANGTQ